MQIKKCSRCCKTLPLESFGSSVRSGDGLQSRCLDCAEFRRIQAREDYAKNRDSIRAYQLEYYQNNLDSYRARCRESSRRRRAAGTVKKPTPEQERDWSLRKLYGITLLEFDQMLEQQGGVCGHCLSAEPSGAGWCIDHDHKCCPGKKSCGQCIRKILCGKCNKGLGLFGDDPDILRATADYVRRTRVLN